MSRPSLTEVLVGGAAVLLILACVALLLWDSGEGLSAGLVGGAGVALAGYLALEAYDLRRGLPPG